MGVAGNQPRKELRANIEYVNDGNLQDGSSQGNKAPKIKLKDDLKIILFLLMQQKEIKNSQNYYEVKYFYITEKTLKKYNQTYNIDEIIQFTNSYYSKLSLNEFNDFNNIVNDIIGYTKIYNEDLKNKKDSEISSDDQMKYFKSNNIKFPNNFSLIEKPFISKFEEILKENNKLSPKKGYLIPITLKKGQANDNIIYILLNYNTKNNNDIYLGISIEKYNFKVDFIFIVNQKYDTNDFIELAKRKIEENKYLIKEKNVRKKINNDIEMICYPENIGKDDYLNNREIYNKIFYYFSICKMYNEFISSFNDIKQHKLKGNEIDINHIQDIILNEKKLLNENLVYLVDEDIFKNQFLDGIIYYFNFNIINNSNDDKKKEMIGNIFEKENNNNKDILFEDLIKPLNYNDIIFNNNKKISLISPELYQKIFKKPEIDYTNIDVNLIKINEEFYIYFNKIKKFVKLIKTGIKDTSTERSRQDTP